VNELEQRAFKRGRTKSGARRRLKWTPDEDKLLAEMYLKHEGQRMSFVIIFFVMRIRRTIVGLRIEGRLKAKSQSTFLESHNGTTLPMETSKQSDLYIFLLFYD
jgi:hypothetical protein